MAIQQIHAPLPGTFYLAPSPTEPSYKSDGDAVAIGDVIGLIEVMKSYYEVKADVTGTVKGFLVANEDAVMAGQPLVDIET